MTIQPNEKINWFLVIIGLERKGYSQTSIAVVLDKGQSTIYGWKMGSTPKWEDGERLIELWSSVTGNNRETVPKVGRYSHLA